MCTISRQDEGIERGNWDEKTHKEGTSEKQKEMGRAHIKTELRQTAKCGILSGSWKKRKKRKTKAEMRCKESFKQGLHTLGMNCHFCADSDIGKLSDNVCNI